MSGGQFGPPDSAVDSRRKQRMKFRDDIDPANTWVISDTHFGHDNIVGFCHRPDDHEQAIIANWRKVVPDDGTVLHVGDLCYGSNGGNTRFRRLTSRELTGERKLLIAGNHDNQRYSFYRDCGFKLARPFAITYGDPDKGQMFDVSFSHYQWSDDEEGRPMNPWDVRIHGHIHNNGYTRDGFVPFLKQHINVSVEQIRYTPVNLKLLLDAALLGEYPETTDEQRAEAQARRALAMQGRLKAA